MARFYALHAAAVLCLNVASLRVSPPERQRRLPTILYSIETCDAPACRVMVEAQLDTWAKNISLNHLIVVGGPYDDEAIGLSRVPMSCGDKIRQFNLQGSACLCEGDRARTSAAR
eukprot:gnl/TRDRNA2_/TRDRNA2_174072_c0_seq12.p1 gnl/TRDRNA2_/TRDRNA2_174072_c0~~gnl/TRDRNA2_/TRDRNA2_174072_c0_seq12.p1  ORF type:complete len:115 (+),score=6.72 gnl/TRDRNA2_/TRDRNA2_174072_c0_seq12:63-407(+)